MSARILVAAVNILVAYWGGGAATAIVRAYACADISGQWQVTESADISCVYEGDFSDTATDTITMNQSGCSISYVRTIGPYTAPRNGIIRDDGTLTMSGPLVIFQPGVTGHENNLTINGVLENDRLITFTGEGRASGSAGGITETCTAASSGNMNRQASDLVVSGVGVSDNEPVTGRPFTVNATVRNQGTVSSGATRCATTDRRTR